MAQAVIQPSFSSGELSPYLYAHVDVQRYHSGASYMRNFFVDYRGGTSNRAGTLKSISTFASTGLERMISFKFNQLQSYALEFGNFYMRVFNNGAPVLEQTFAITAVTTANPAAVTTGLAHGYSTGDVVLISNNNLTYAGTAVAVIGGKYFRITVTGANTFTLQSEITNLNIDTTTAIGGATLGSVNRVLKILTPYSVGDVALIKITQSADTMTLTHPNYQPQQVKRLANNVWTIGAAPFGPKFATVTGGAALAGTAGTTTYRYVVTAVSSDGTDESVASAPFFTAVSATMSTTAGAFVTLSWTAIVGVSGYNIYRQGEVPSGAQANGATYGYIGSSNTNGFVDHNTAPDFGTTPPVGANPFAGGSIGSVTVTAGGAAYVPETVLAVSDSGVPGGTGAVLQPVVAGGAITGVNVINGGQNYKSPSIAATTRVGTGAVIVITAGNHGSNVTNGDSIAVLAIVSGGSNYASNVTATHPNFPGSLITLTIDANGTIIATVISNGGAFNGPPLIAEPVNTLPPLTITQVQVGTGVILTPNLIATPNNPGCSTYYQGRQVYAGSNPNPLTLWASRPASFLNMDYSVPSQPDDSLTVTLVAREINQIRHLLPMNSLIVLTSGGAWRVDGGSQSDVLAPGHVIATPQAYNGVSDVPPIPINYDILYVQAKGSIVRDLSYNFYVNVYTGSDVSVMSQHLFDQHTIREWAFAEEPHKMIWAVRDDGVMLTLTWVKEQEIQGWAWHDTIGQFQSVCSIPENGQDVIYMIVARPVGVGGAMVGIVERMQPRNIGGDLMSSWFLDSAVNNSLTFDAVGANVTATPQDANGNVTLTADFHVFSAGNVGNLLIMNGGYGRVTQFISIFSVKVQMYKPMRTLSVAPLGACFLIPPVTTITGLDHLNGQTVSVFADGGVQAPKVVANGFITLDQPASVVVVGLPYFPMLRTMYLDVGDPTIQGKRKNIYALTVRTAHTVGLQVGPTFDNVKDIKVRNTDMIVVPPPIGARSPNPISYQIQPGMPTPAETGDIRDLMSNDYNVPGQICMVQPNPLPTTILGVIPEIVVGDSVN